MLLNEIVAVYSENCTKPVNIRCETNTQLLMIKMFYVYLLLPFQVIEFSYVFSGFLA